MRLLSVLVVASVLLANPGCVAGSRDTVAPGPGGCELSSTGPLIGYSYQAGPPSSPAGGAIADGIYDLTQIVDHGRASGPWSSNNAPAFRWAIRFTTEERSPNHSAGRLTMAIDLPPAQSCDTGRFATVAGVLRTQTRAHPELNEQQYTVTPDGLLILSRGQTYVFRRRR